ncbi:hypothetical protein EJ06DRAFT_237469 [Trichodelitschia bisporula]|uniref:Uncharacterized protein n=1 Tax=Trichodelitschia bisporula TaxID=703511 RepID=A0A6G1HKF0_9PEZI|nr:hypothetical protein EJ06DRAFT_237469 [Trichodelitschia bisporula]
MLCYRTTMLPDHPQPIVVSPLPPSNAMLSPCIYGRSSSPSPSSATPHSPRQHLPPQPHTPHHPYATLSFPPHTCPATTASASAPTPPLTKLFLQTGHVGCTPYDKHASTAVPSPPPSAPTPGGKPTPAPPYPAPDAAPRAPPPTS